MENNRKNRTLIIVIMFTVIIAVLGSTLAYLSWQSSEEQQTNVTFTATTDFTCAADGGGNITSADALMAPTTCTDTDRAIKRTVTVTPTINTAGKTVYMDLWLDVNDLGTGLSESQNFKYALTSSSTNCTTDVVTSGTFNGLTTGGSVPLLTGQEYPSSGANTYYLWIWLDAAETSTATMNQTFDLSLNGSCADVKKYKDDILNGADPVLPEGLIPVTIADDGTVTTASAYDEWYNYTDKEWANAVLVSSSGTQTREYYESNSNVTVNQDDILAYYVWIPKYSYQMNGTEESISISFNSTPSGYIEHPAFTFGSEELSGIWVGKFETTGSATTPTILPNTTPLTNQNVSTQFQTALKFVGGTLSSGAVAFTGSDTYGLTDEANSHMMKDSEWGAAAYLSHSIYGINGEIRINNYNNSGRMTGCGAATADTTSSSSTCEIAYGGATEYPQSTTGNITGIFDMSGGSWEYVMGVFANSSGSLWTGNSSSTNSGFNGLYRSSATSYTSYTSGIVFPTETKYYDKYQATSGTTISAKTACSGGICYGHALSETSGWYDDYANFVSSSYPWFGRGGSFATGASTGAFSFYHYSGNALSNFGFRSVLVA